MAQDVVVAAPVTRLDEDRPGISRRLGSGRGLLPTLLFLFFGTGACGLVYQQLWVRQLSLVFGVTVYAVSTVLASFFAGLALGSFVAGRFVDRARRPLQWYGIVEILVGVAALGTTTALAGVDSRRRHQLQYLVQALAGTVRVGRAFVGMPCSASWSAST